MARFAAKGTVLKRGDGGDPEVFATVGQLLSFDEVGSERDLIDASAFGDDDKQYVTGMRDGSAITMTVAGDAADTVHAALKSDYDNSALRNFEMVHPDGTTTRSFTGLVTSYSEGGDRDGIFQFTIGVKITGAIT